LIPVVSYVTKTLVAYVTSGARGVRNGLHNHIVQYVTKTLVEYGTLRVVGYGTMVLFLSGYK
jgi:hypothetical protein